MASQRKQIAAALSELKDAAWNGEYNNIASAMQKYGVLFFGAPLNRVNCAELLACLQNHFGIEVDAETLLAQLAGLCASLDMALEPQITQTDIGRAKPAGNYNLVLFSG